MASVVRSRTPVPIAIPFALACLALIALVALIALPEPNGQKNLCPTSLVGVAPAPRRGGEAFCPALLPCPPALPYCPTALLPSCPPALLPLPTGQVAEARATAAGPVAARLLRKGKIVATRPNTHPHKSTRTRSHFQTYLVPALLMWRFQHMFGAAFVRAWAASGLAVLAS